MVTKRRRSDEENGSPTFIGWAVSDTHVTFLIEFCVNVPVPLFIDDCKDNHRIRCVTRFFHFFDLLPWVDFMVKG
ncbi:MAG: hypothetical protein GW939_00365 [Candidatus Magasanikbacteria bacterium]|nr:hypothetical protein [Candidatus Magasanikbacteria bacterium]